MTSSPKAKRAGVRDGQIQELDDNDIDFELLSSSNFLGSHSNTVPMPSAVQVHRTFFGAKLVNQALPVTNAEAPLVQNLDDTDPDGRSFDDLLGKFAGALRSDEDGEVQEVSDKHIKLKTASGERNIPLYNSFVFNRKSSITQTPRVKVGDVIKKGGLLAKSNYTDDNGTLAMGLNARIGLVPYKGHSMDDAIVISQSFANRLSGHKTLTFDEDFDDNTKPGKGHFVSLFQDKFVKDQLDKLDTHGVVVPGTVLQPGDPMILATRPKSFSSSTAQLGKLSGSLRNARSDASKIWDHDEPGMVSDVAYTKNGVKVVVHSVIPTKEADKLSLRNGQKATVSLILPDEHMPRTLDGKPLEVLANQQGIPSRVNPNMVYEILLGKIARATGKPYKIPPYTKKGENWYDFVEGELKKHNITPEEEVFDPQTNKKLENPITVGEAFMLKLVHTAEDKISQRSQGAYDSSQQPAKGPGDYGSSKRHSGLESAAVLSAGGYNTLREMSTIRGTRNDQYWRDIKMGLKPKDPGIPFVFRKFLALLSGAGMNAKEVAPGKLRLGPMTEQALSDLNPVDLDNADIINPKTMEPIRGGLFDPAIVSGNKWARIKLPYSVPNPAFETSIRKILGMTQKQFDAVMSGREELPDHLRGLNKAAAAGAEIDWTTIEKQRQAAREATAEPTVDQVEAGNYKKGIFKWIGFTIVIENAKGDNRIKYGKDGKVWSRRMTADYGYVRGFTCEADGDAHDVYIGPKLSSDVVYAIDQATDKGKFDETKYMIGYISKEEAEKAYLSHYPADWKESGRLMKVTSITTDQIRSWFREGDSSKPASGQMVKLAMLVGM